jgi:hypothetical protein
MTSNSKPKRQHSPEAKERMSKAAAERHGKNATKIEERVRAAMIAIESELTEKGAANAELSPTVAEVARRANIHEITLYKPRYEVLLAEVQAWKKRLSNEPKEDSTTGKANNTGGVKRSLKTRVSEWKKLYEDLKDSHRLTEADLVIVSETLKTALAENEELKRRIAELTKVNGVQFH